MRGRGRGGILRGYKLVDGERRRRRVLAFLLCDQEQ